MVGTVVPVLKYVEFKRGLCSFLKSIQAQRHLFFNAWLFAVAISSTELTLPKSREWRKSNGSVI